MANYDLIVIGEGVAGLTAAGAAAKQGLTVATIEANLFGGLVINIADLHNCAEGGSGVDLASRLMEENANAGVTSINAPVTGVSGGPGAFRVEVDGDAHGARALIVASGASLRKLGVPGEEQFDHRGVSQCADCDGPMFQGEHVVVVGGGDAAFQEAVTLTQFVDRVTLLMRGATPRARAEFVDAVKANDKITLRANSEVTAIKGGDMVTGLTVRSAGNTEEIAAAGAFIFIGLAPNSGFLPAAVERDGAGAVKTGADLQTTQPGIFAVGAVRSGYSGRLDDAIAEARRAAQAVARSVGG